MIEIITLTFQNNRIYIGFQSVGAKEKFLTEMTNSHINMFIDEAAQPFCYIKPYYHSSPTGQFVSSERRLGLAFLSEKHKFIFKEIIGLSSEHFMDLGSGYDAQLHFNETLFPCILVSRYL